MHHAKTSRYMVVVTGNSSMCVCTYRNGMVEWNTGMTFDPKIALKDYLCIVLDVLWKHVSHTYQRRYD